MQRLVADAETYYDTEYSLRKMKAAAYIRDARFAVHGWSVILDDQAPQWLSHLDFKDFLASLDPNDIRLVGHNLNFDGLILHEHYDFRPAVYADTLYMANAFLHDLPNKKLDTIAEFLGLGNKIAGTLGSLKGVRDLTPEQFDALGIYAIQDAKLTGQIDDILYPMVLPQERHYMHLHTRMGVQPKALVDRDVVIEGLAIHEREVREAIEKSGTVATVLRSDDQFAKFLGSLGLEVPKKESLKTGAMIPALAKGDWQYQQLKAEHPEFSGVFEGREAANSSITKTRGETFLSITERVETLPFPYAYCGAHTGRGAGRDGLNLQNLTNGSFLRHCITAPKDHFLLVADSSQIELRVNAVLAGEGWLVDVLRAGKCPYIAGAAKTFGKDPGEGTKTSSGEITTEERKLGKMQELGLGFQMGAPKFKDQLAAGLLGNDPIIKTLDEVYDWVNTYRDTHPAIVQQWRDLQHCIPLMMNNHATEWKMGITFHKEAIELPSGRMLLYPGLHCDEDLGWRYSSTKKLYGGLLDENIVQAIARDVVFEQVAKIDAELKAWLTGMTHDEGIFIVHERDIADVEQMAIEIMSVPPTWMPELPVACEAGYAVNYSK